MKKIILLLFASTLLFAQIEIIDKHTLEIGNWVKNSEISKSEQFISRHIKNNLDILAHNPNLENASKEDIWKYFLTTKTGKFIARHGQLMPRF